MFQDSRTSRKLKISSSSLAPNNRKEVLITSSLVLLQNLQRAILELPVLFHTDFDCTGEEGGAGDEGDEGDKSSTGDEGRSGEAHRIVIGESQRADGDIGGESSSVKSMDTNSCIDEAFLRVPDL